jgi:hypothetical protein
VVVVRQMFQHLAGPNLPQMLGRPSQGQHLRHMQSISAMNTPLSTVPNSGITLD